MFFCFQFTFLYVRFMSMAKRGRKSVNPFRDLMASAVEEPLKALVKELRKQQKELERSITRELNRVWKELGKVSGRSGRKAKVGRKKTGAAKGKRPGRKPKHEKCTIKGCDRPHYAKGLCTRHYQQWRKGKISLPQGE